MTYLPLICRIALELAIALFFLALLIVALGLEWTGGGIFATGVALAAAAVLLFAAGWKVHVWAMREGWA